MSCHPQVYQWSDTLRTAFPHLSQPQITVLALWSLGMVLARSCALTAVSLILAATLGQRANTVRQRLREFCYEAPAKRGRQRRELGVERCFVPLARWILRHWQGTQVALALDATTLSQRFTVLAISLVYRGAAIPVAWTVLPATTKHAWKPEWLRLLRRLRPAIPRHFTVIVLADRGLYARWLFRRIVRLGWHPLLRINRGGTFRPTGQRGYWPLTSFVPAAGSAWQGTGTAFQGQARHLPCTLLARWEVGAEEPWLLLTDLPPEASDACWYGLRAWIEHGFKLMKRGGWQWQRTRMTDPERAARLWLALAVATVWLVSVGGEADAPVSEGAGAALPAAGGLSPQPPRPRLVSVFRRGEARILAALLDRVVPAVGQFWPELWPHQASPPEPIPRLSHAAA